MAQAEIVIPDIAINPKELLEKIGVDVKLSKNDLFDIMEEDILDQYKERQKVSAEKLQAFCQEQSITFAKAEERLQKCKEVTQLLKAFSSMSASVKPDFYISLDVEGRWYANHRNIGGGKDPVLRWSLVHVYNNQDAPTYNQNIAQFHGRRYASMQAWFQDGEDDGHSCLMGPTFPQEFTEAVPMSVTHNVHKAEMYAAPLSPALAKKIKAPSVIDVYREWQGLQAAHSEAASTLQKLPTLAKRGRVKFLRDILAGTEEGRQLGNLLSTATGATIMKTLRK